jgi:hypothetical protein
MQTAPRVTPECAPSPWLLAAQSRMGRVWLAAFAAAALYPGLGRVALLFAAAIALASFRPAWRRPILSAVAILVCARNLSPKFTAGIGAPANLPAWLTLALLALWIAGLLAWTRFLARLPAWMGRHAIPLMHAKAFVLIACLWLLRGRGVLTGAAAAAMCLLVPELLWRSTYWIKWRARQPGPVAIWNNLFAALPFLGAGGVPLGKGPAFLGKHEALGAAQLAAAQLEGAKLLALALVWRVSDGVLSAVVLSQKSAWVPAWAYPAHPWLPTMSNLLQIPGFFPLWQRWAGLYVELFHAILVLAIFSHTLVGILCLSGFHVPRNIRSPLLATTILDFWGRYYFYFKELLMDFWFFPVFLRTARLPVFWRTMLATVSAAFLGNIYYHLVLYWPSMARGETAPFQAAMSARVIYCAFLAAALCVSFARTLGRKTPAGPPGFPRRLFRILLVSSFFALIHVWNFTGVPVLVYQRARLWRALLPWW